MNLNLESLINVAAPFYTKVVNDMRPSIKAHKSNAEAKMDSKSNHK